MIDWIDLVRQVKKDVFISTLNIYDSVLGKSNNFDFDISRSIDSFNNAIEICNGSIKRRGNVSLVLAFMLSLALPYNILINGSQITIDIIQKKHLEKQIENIKVDKDNFKKYLIVFIL